MLKGQTMGSNQAIPTGPTLEEQAAFFDEWNARHRAMKFEEVDAESRARADSVLAILGSLPVTQPKVIEVGCGTGWLTEKIACLGEVTATDLSPRAIEIAKERKLSAKFLAGDFYHNSFPAGSFDVAICVETISTVPDQPLFLHKLAALIKPGGHLIITAVNKFVYQRRSEIGSPKPGNVRKWLSRKEFHQLLSEDFRIVRSTTVLPRGDRGVLRVINSSKVHLALSLLFSQGVINGVKEALGLGHCRIILAQRRGSGPASACGSCI